MKIRFSSSGTLAEQESYEDIWRRRRSPTADQADSAAFREELGLLPQNLAECFFDVDGEPLFDRLQDLCRIASLPWFPPIRGAAIGRSAAVAIT